MNTKGKFIVLDGIDGCGKGTQVKLLVSYLFDHNKKNHIFFTREPYNSEYGIEIRRLLKEGVNPKDNAETFTNLFVKDRKVHIEIIQYLLNRGISVVCDRYKYSTLAYQQTQGISLKKLIGMHDNILIPDLIIIIDVPAEVALDRAEKDSNRTHREVFEQKNFQEELRKNYLNFPTDLPNEKIIIIDGNRSVEKVFESIKAVVAPYIQYIQ